MVCTFIYTPIPGAGDLDFDNFHLRKDVWEEAARKAGFLGELKWDVPRIPEDFMEQPQKYGEETMEVPVWLRLYRISKCRIMDCS